MSREIVSTSSVVAELAHKALGREGGCRAVERRPVMSYSDDEKKPWWWPLTDVRALWVAIGVVAILALTANAAFWLTDGDGDTTQVGGTPVSQKATDGNQEPNAGTGTHSHETPMPADDALDASGGGTSVTSIASCETRWQAQGRPLLAAQKSLQQWRLHVGAMNRLVAGQISLAQATAFWNQTRLGAIRNVERFKESYGYYEAGAEQCMEPGQSTSSDDDVTLRKCVRAARVGDRVLGIAELAITTWEHHVHDMEMLRTGQITPAQATAMWQASWRAGNRQLTRYEHAVGRALRMQCP